MQVKNSICGPINLWRPDMPMTTTNWWSIVILLQWKLKATSLLDDGEPLEAGRQTSRNSKNATPYIHSFRLSYVRGSWRMFFVSVTKFSFRMSSVQYWYEFIMTLLKTVTYINGHSHGSMFNYTLPLTRSVAFCFLRSSLFPFPFIRKRQKTVAFHFDVLAACLLFIVFDCFCIYNRVCK